MPQGSMAWRVTMSMYWSNRVGIPTATDPEGITGPGNWWVTGHARPGLLPWPGDSRRVGLISRIRRRRRARREAAHLHGELGAP